MDRRHFLFLQGCNSPFFARLRDRLREAGHGVARVNFSMGDRVFWLGRPARAFRGREEDWPETLRALFREHGYTDVVMMGDTRSLNRAAIPVARAFGARVHVLEEGYFRPNWITVEEGGVNGHSALPRDPDWYREAATLVPDYGDGEWVGNPLRNVVAYGLRYRIPNLLNPVLYPHYRTHRPRVAAVEFYGWLRRYARLGLRRKADAATVEALSQGPTPYYLLPLQLSHDSQIREHSRFPAIPWVIKRVINSFLRHAPAESQLVIKLHPLDNDFVDYAGWIRRLERRLGVEGRVRFLESGHMPTLLTGAAGVVTVNSTVGPSALIHGCPVITLGEAVYDLPGLTFQGHLNDFWRGGERPDRSLFRAFRNVVIHTTQVNGAFYSRQGIERGAATCAERLQADCLPLEALKARVPPPRADLQPAPANATSRDGSALPATERLQRA